jgi:hypothetical protein
MEEPNKGTEEQNTTQGGEPKIDPVEFQNLKSVIGRQGNELGQLKAQLGEAHNKLSLYDQEKEIAATKAAESEKALELGNALMAVNDQIAGLDVTDPDYSKTLAKLQKEAFSLAEQKGREETLAMAKDSFSKELSKRDQIQQERKAQKVVTQFHQENPDFKELQESGALDQVIQGSEGFHDPVSAFLKVKVDKLSEENARLTKLLNLSKGERQTESVITSSGQNINVNPGEKLGPQRTNPRMVDEGMRAVLRQMRGGAG